MRKVRFVQADVFSDSPFGGNPVVVVPDPGHMTADEMQALARGMAFSETAFVVPVTLPEAAFALRCFTPTTELAFSGHQLLGAAFVLAGLGRLPMSGATTEVLAEVGGELQPVLFEHPSGAVVKVAIREHPGRFEEPLRDVGAVATALGVNPMTILHTGLPVQVVTTGLRCLIVPLESLQAVREMMPVMQAVNELLHDSGAHCLLVFAMATLRRANDLHVRVFAPPLGIEEDPATGTANGALAAYLVRHGAVVAGPGTRLRSEQGSEIGRPSVIDMRLEGSGDALSIRVGGRVARSVEGTVFY